MAETILVTGINGFIGSLLAAKLLARGYKVVGLEHPACDLGRIRPILRKLKLYRLENESVGKIFTEQKIDGVVHLATYYKKQHTRGDIQAMFRTNVELPALLLDLGTAAGLKWFINTGSFFEYAWDGGALSEKAPIAPWNLYAATKTAFDEVVKAYARGKGLKAMTIRLFSPYGPRDNADKLIPYLIGAALDKKAVRLSSLPQKLAFIYVEDIVDAYVKAVKKMRSLKKHETVNIGGRNSYSAGEVAGILEDISGAKLEKNYFTPPAGALSTPVRADLRKAGRLLGWRPRHDIRSGLKKTFEAYRSAHGI